MSFQPTKPQYRLKFQTREGKKRKGSIGAGWLMEDGSISIHLDPLVVLKEESNYQITLFKISDR